MDALEVAIARNECSPQAMYQNMMEICDQDEKEIAELKAENERLKEAIEEFCKNSEWNAEAWKRQSWIAPIFEINK
jgi:hypothetical protein